MTFDDPPEWLRKMPLAEAAQYCLARMDDWSAVPSMRQVWGERHWKLTALRVQEARAWPVCCTAD